MIVRSRSHNHSVATVAVYTRVTLPLYTANVTVTLTTANFRNVNFRIVNFRIVNFRNVNFRNVNFRIVNFRNVNFRIVNFRIVNFRNVNLATQVPHSRARLRRGSATDARLASVRQACTPLRTLMSPIRRVRRAT